MYVQCTYTVGQKTGLFLRSDNFATTDDRKTCNRLCQKFQDFAWNEMHNLHVNAVKYSFCSISIRIIVKQERFLIPSHG